MITVSILINGNAIATRSAVNVGITPEEKSIYKLDDGSTILHRRENGTVVLAIEILKSIKEVGNENGIAKKTRPMEGQRIKCFGRNQLPIGEGIYHNARIVKNHSRAFVSLEDGFWASWNSVKRWTPSELQIL
jgi:hypothetical protein